MVCVLISLMEICIGYLSFDSRGCQTAVEHVAGVYKSTLLTHFPTPAPGLPAGQCMLCSYSKLVHISSSEPHHMTIQRWPLPSGRTGLKCWIINITFSWQLQRNETYEFNHGTIFFLLLNYLGYGSKWSLVWKGHEPSVFAVGSELCLTPRERHLEDMSVHWSICNLNREIAEPRKNHKFAYSRVCMNGASIPGRERSVKVACKNKAEW